MDRRSQKLEARLQKSEVTVEPPRPVFYLLPSAFGMRHG